MAKTRPGRRVVDSFTINGSNKLVLVGDCVLMRPSEPDSLPYVARVERIEANHRNCMTVKARWFYRPEETLSGRLQCHGSKELFLSDHYDDQSVNTIEDTCIVHTYKNFTKLDNPGAEDYFWRFEYQAATGVFTPDSATLYCKCEMPYDPADLMVQCEGCKDWFHPRCLDMTTEEAQNLEHFTCSECSVQGSSSSSADA